MIHREFKVAEFGGLDTVTECYQKTLPGSLSREGELEG